MIIISLRGRALNLGLGAKGYESDYAGMPRPRQPDILSLGWDHSFSVKAGLRSQVASELPVIQHKLRSEGSLRPWSRQVLVWRSSR